MRRWNVAIGLAVGLISSSTAIGQGDDRLVGVWGSDEGFRTSKLLFRSNGRYQLDSQSTDPNIGWATSERGHYRVEGEALSLTPYDYLIKPEPRWYQFALSAEGLSLTGGTFGQTQLFKFRPGSKAEVLAREQVDPRLIGIWRRHIAFLGELECTFRPDGYYVSKRTHDDPQFGPVYVRGRYGQAGNQLTLKPYNEAEEVHEMDFFGAELTLIKTDSFSSSSATFDAVVGSETDVRIKTAEAGAFLERTNWPVGVWDIRDANQVVELTLRPDGRYLAERETGWRKEIVRGRYTVDSRRMHLMPFAGQDIYSLFGGEFGNVEQKRKLDYYDGELQFIDAAAILPSVTVARRRPGSEAAVMASSNQAQAELAREGWWGGTWQVKDAAGWMEFTFRPDQRYIVKAGTKGAAEEVERGRYRFAANKLTIAPYANSGEPRGFGVDLYDGALLLIGDPSRMVLARKIPGSEVSVTNATTDPEALKGADGPLVGLWTLHLNDRFSEILFRPDGQFRLARCVEGKLEHEYGLYSVNLPSRTLVLDSRLAERVTAGLDFYAGTMTLISTNWGFPATYVINTGQTDAALQASFVEDVAEAELDAQWLRRVTVGPRNPDIGPVPSLPTDLRPGHVFDAATVFTQYRHYQRLIPSFVYTTPVVNSQDWHFLRNGRVLIRFVHHRALPHSPVIVSEIIDVWGAYRIEPNQGPQDILHFYADDSLRIETDLGEQLELALEDGRRHLFWDRNRAVLDEWAAVQRPIACQPPAKFDPGLMNTGISLQTKIAPDDFTEAIRFSLARSVAGNLTIQGTISGAATLVTEHAASLTSPILWQALQINAIPGGAFNFTIPASTSAQCYYRLKRQ